jgi:urea transporter
MNNPLTGLIIFIALLVQSSRVALHGLIGVVSSNVLALIFGFDDGLVFGGLFGYNAVLCGLALATFDNEEVNAGWNVTNVVVVCTSAGSAIMFVALGKLLAPYKTPPFTLPFNICTLWYMVATSGISTVSMGPVVTPGVANYTKALDHPLPDSADIIQGIFKGVGQIFLAGDLAPSILILIGLGVCSRITAFAALLGSAVGLCTGMLTGAGAGKLAKGLYGYNASLTSAAIFGMFYAPSVSSFLVAVLASILTAVSQEAVATLLLPYGLPVATMPFCFVACLLVLIQGTNQLLIAIPLESMTVPEDHWARVSMIRRIFSFLEQILNGTAATNRGYRHYSARTHGRRSLTALKDMFSSMQNEAGLVAPTDVESVMRRMDNGVSPAVLQTLFRKLKVVRTRSVSSD